MARKFIAIEQDGIVEVHAFVSGGSYQTLCGIDGDDSTVGQRPAELPPGAKIDCTGCRTIWQNAKRYRAS